MKILIAGDQRIFFSKDCDNWADRLIKKYPNHHIDAKPVSTLLRQLEELEKAGKKYDLLVSQIGNHDYIIKMPADVFRNKFSRKDPSYRSKLTKMDNGRFRYRNDERIKRGLVELRRYCANVLLIGMHVNRINNEDCILMVNDVFDNHVDYFNVPVHLGWRDKHCYDESHYNRLGHEYVYKYVDRYLSRIDKTVTSTLDDIYGG